MVARMLARHSLELRQRYPRRSYMQYEDVTRVLKGNVHSAYASRVRSVDLRPFQSISDRYVEDAHGLDHPRPQGWG